MNAGYTYNVSIQGMCDTTIGPTLGINIGSTTVIPQTTLTKTLTTYSGTFIPSTTGTYTLYMNINNTNASIDSTNSFYNLTIT